MALPLNIKHHAGYVTVSFSVPFKINYASVWHHRFGAKTNSPVVHHFSCAGADSGERSLMMNTPHPKRKGTASQESKVFPRNIQMCFSSLVLEVDCGCLTEGRSRTRMRSFSHKSQKLSILKERTNMQVKCHRTISALMWTKRLKASHPWGKMLYPCIYLYSGCYGFFECPYRPVCTSSTSSLWRTSPGGAWLHWWACTACLRALFLLPGERHP